MKGIRLITCFTLLLLLMAGHVAPAQDAATLYKTYCAGCHGAQLEGNTATALIKENWTYGRNRGDFIRNIRFGIPSTEMVGWGRVLKKEDIGALADFIIAAQETPPAARRPLPESIVTEEYVLKAEVVVPEGLQLPWAIEFVDAQRALITERDGRLRWMVDGRLDPEPIADLPPIHAGTGLAGLMDVALDPDYARNGWVYLAHSHTNETPGDASAHAMTRVIRGRIADHRWQDQEVLFQVPDSLMVQGGTRWGCRLLFDQVGDLHFSIGDMNRGPDSQDPALPAGKTFRIHADGSVPADNPFTGVAGALPQVFTLGNRNVQGMAQHPVTGKIWATEHGPMGGDELNILEKGANYGWPLVTYGKDYDGSTVSEVTQKQGFQQPINQWTPSIAICPATFCSSDLFPKWKNSLFVGALAYEELRRLEVGEDQVVSQEMILKNYGRVRDVKFSPDGSLYVVLNAPDVIVRLRPVMK